MSISKELQALGSLEEECRIDATCSFDGYEGSFSHTFERPYADRKLIIVLEACGVWGKLGDWKYGDPCDSFGANISAFWKKENGEILEIDFFSFDEENDAPLFMSKILKKVRKDPFFLAFRERKLLSAMTPHASVPARAARRI